VAIRAKGASEVQSFRLNDRSRKPPISVLTALGDEAVVSDLSRQTVLQHEIRHFHDCLLYPFGHVTTRSRIAASYNGFLVAMVLRRLKKDANALAVPLQQWLLMPETEREAFLGTERRRTGRDLRTPVLPVLRSDDDLSEFGPGLLELPNDEETLMFGLRMALADYRTVEDLWRSPYREGDEMIAPAVDAWEASGLICQFAAIENITNTEMMNRFSTWIQKYGPQAYRRGLQVLFWCLEQLDWPLTLRNLLAVASWAQLGAFKTEIRESAPVNRLYHIVNAAKQGKRWPSDSKYLDLVRSWDDVIETDSVAALVDASADFKRYAVDLAEQDSGPGGLLGSSFFTGLSAAHQLMLTAFLDDPDTYVDPFTYLASDAAYPAPCIGIEYPAGPENGIDWIDATPVEWSPKIEFDATLGLAAAAELADAIFLPGEKSLQRSGRSVVRKRLDLEAVRIIR
jgi:hypothetical protein